MAFRTSILATAVAFAATAAPAQDWAVDLYAGLTLERNENYEGVLYLTEIGRVFGAGVYRDGLRGGLSLGLDVMSTRALYVGYPGEYIESLSLMAVVRKNFQIKPNLNSYVSGGLGAIRNIFEDTGIRYSDTVFGGQVALGVSYELASGPAIFSEVKYQKGFEDGYFSALDESQAYHSTSVVLGVRLGF